MLQFVLGPALLHASLTGLILLTSMIMIIYTPSVMTNVTILILRLSISRFWIATFQLRLLMVYCICITTNSLLKGLFELFGLPC
jgi:hypothetical protein